MSSKKSVSQKYKLLEVIGRGKFGTVHKAIDVDSKHLIAIKILNLDTDNEEVKDIQQEIGFLSKLKTAPNITHYFGSYLNGHKLWILMDYCAGGSVRTLLKPGPLNEKYISIISRELFIALQFIHENGVIHRDIKAANILISKDGKVKLCDFGVAAQLTSSKVKRTTMAGTPYWMAPEVIREGATYNSKADVWSAGITIYEMATGNPPYSDKDALRVMQIITQHEPPRLEGRQYSALQKEIIALCLEEDPELRPSAETILKSKFIKSSKTLPTTTLKEVIGKYLVWRDNRNKSISKQNNSNLSNTNLENANVESNRLNIPENKISHHQTPSMVSLSESYISMDDSENIKWDFDSLKSTEYIIENDIVLQNDDNFKFEDSEFDINNKDATKDFTRDFTRDFTTSPYNKTFTIGNTLMNGIHNDSRITTASGTASASTTQIDSIINSFDQVPKIINPPKSLVDLFPESSSNNNNNSNNNNYSGIYNQDSTNSIHLNNAIIDRNTDKNIIDNNDHPNGFNNNERKNSRVEIQNYPEIDHNGSYYQHNDELKKELLGNNSSFNQMRQPQITSPLISIEIPNMDNIENEIQEREKQRSRAATVTLNNNNNNNNNSNNNMNINNNNINSNSNTHIVNPIDKPDLGTHLRYESDQPLPMRKPTISLAYNRTPSPARMLEQINTNLLPNSQEQTSPLHMKPLPISAQPLLQPINGTLKGKPQINLSNISNHKAVSNNGPQTAPVVSSSNAELFDSALKSRNQIRIQMPVPMSATASSFPNINSNNNNIINSNNTIEKNQFGFEINSASTVPMAMTPVTERSQLGHSTPEKELYKREISTEGHFNNSNSTNSSFSLNTNTNTTSKSINSENIMKNEPTIKKIPSTTKHVISPSSNLKNSVKSNTNISNMNINMNLLGNKSNSASVSTLNSTNNRNNDSTTNLERKMSVDSNLKFQPSLIYPQQLNQQNNENENPNSFSNLNDGRKDKDKENDNEKTITGLGMMRINDSGNVSPMKAASHYDNKKEYTLQKCVKSSQKSLEKISNHCITLTGIDTNNTLSNALYINEIESMLDNMNSVLDVIVDELK